MSARGKQPADKIAAVEDYAAMAFGGTSEAIEALGTASEWRDRTRAHYPTIFFALSVLKDDQDGVAGHVAAEPDAFVELHKCVEDVRLYYEALADLLNTASVRIVAGLSRHVLADEQQAGETV